MSRPKSWKYTKIEDGVSVVTLSHWRYFDDYIRDELLNFRTYIFRGQAEHTWPLESSLDRFLRAMSHTASLKALKDHLLAFQQASRGRRGLNPPELKDENDWWALGQHFGLETPLLDFTESPFVALYFAFLEELQGSPEYRAVWALSESSVEHRTRDLKAQYEIDRALRNAESRLETIASESISSAAQKSGATKKTPPPQPPVVAEIVRPRSNENARLVNQRGLFVRVPIKMTLDDWIRGQFRNDSKYLHLIKIRIPNRERANILVSLNRMNINSLSLFPDLYGASKYCNTALRIKSY